MPGFKWYAILITGCLLGLLAVGRAQDKPQIRTRVDLVVVPVSVRDSSGKLIGGLHRDDFTILEDERLQTISNFSADPQPLSAAIVVDDAMDGLSLRRLAPLFVSVAAGFAESDEMAAFRFDHFVTNLAEFTNDPTVIEKSFEIVKSIAAKQPGQRPPSNSGLFVAGPMPGPFGGRNPNTTTTPPIPGPTPALASRVLNDAIYAAAKSLESRPADRRKIIFVISDGQNAGSEHSQKETLELLLRNNIQVFAVSTELGVFEKMGGNLSDYARVTGGDVYSGGSTKAMERGFADITDQARNQYVLGYVSNNEVRGNTGVFRNLEVRTRNPNWRVTYRKGYTQYP
jgi:VWFA-related protein